MIYFREPIQEGGLFVHRLAFLAPTTTFIHRTYAPVNIVKSGLDSDWPYKFSLIPPTPCGQPSTDPVLTSLCHGSIQLRSLETGAHLRTFEVPDDYTGALHKKFLALPGQNHFVFMKKGYVSVFEPDRSLKYLKRKQLKCEGYACSICYTPDRSSLAIRVWEGHLYFQDLATSEIRTYPSFFPRPEGLGEESLLEISLNGHIAAYEGSDSLVVEIYNLAYGPARAMKILEHPSHPLSKKRITDIRWSKDQSHMITIIRPWPPKYTNSSCYLWDMETSNYQELDLGADGSADFGDNGLAILALRAEIHLIDCSTFELKTVIPIYPLHHSMCQRVFGHHGVVMTPLLGGTRGILFYDTSVKSRSSHRFSTSDVLPQAYKDNVFQNSVKHKLRVQDLELVNGWLVMKPDIKLVWIPFPFTYLVKDESMDQITIPNEYDDIRLVLDCKLMEKYLL
ncbi:hypothetical protein BDN72DRAFT_573247 [Pluteus cervinus]|uniref:Uncharacterized protein n=1 Tax=Pluteus cervinus TaxID=181527 RepID=A0ACD3AVK6_9AGAR|nr:hypothetical protein BDN72DRAFT_573247 [Pluteus cervinus]